VIELTSKKKTIGHLTLRKRRVHSWEFLLFGDAYDLLVNGKETYCTFLIKHDGEIEYTTDKMKGYKRLLKNWREEI
jgi:hypothetical protein